MRYLSRNRLDTLCVLLLIGLWALFFWRLITPVKANQLSLVDGDFSGQFVAYAGYQAARLSHGQIPLWNPFNNSGHPFLADTQSAALYPPRLITLALVNASGSVTPGLIYNALQLEMAAHVLIASLLMYALLRRITASEGDTAEVGTLVTGTLARCVGSLVAALTFGYGGYLTGYPPLQLAVLEAGIWMPLALIGLHEATRIAHIGARWIGWIAVAGVALGLSLHAGHPQTTLQVIYLCGAYLAYRVWRAKQSWRVFVAGLILFGAIGGGLAAVQLIPGWEFSRLTARSASFTFDSQGNGFPLYDLAQVIFPGVVSLWSPLYFGVAGLALAALAILSRWRGRVWFWVGCAAVALGLSFGHNTIIYDVFYTLIPGFSLFRGQERAAYTVAICTAILAGFGTIRLLDGEPLPARYSGSLRATLAGIGLIVGVFYFHWQTTPGDDPKRLGLLAFSLIIGALLIALLAARTHLSTHWQAVGIVALVVFDLFTVGRNVGGVNYETRPALDRLGAPSLVQTVQADQTGVYRVDGNRGLLQNYGSLYGVSDINGISPLRLDRYEKLLSLPAPRAWEVLAVRYVFTPDNQLPIPSTVIGQGSDPLGKINLHKLSDPRPFARLVYRTWIAPDDGSALNALADPNIDLRQTVILPADPVPALTLPAQPPDGATAEIVTYAPEAFTIKTHSATVAILDVAQVNYPGWDATLDDQAVPILRANLTLMAISVPAGDHVLRFRYEPLTVLIGAAISLITLIMLITLLVVGLILSIRARKSL